MLRSLVAIIAIVLAALVSTIGEAKPGRPIRPQPIPAVATFIHYLDDASKGITFHVPMPETHIKGCLVIRPDYQWGDTTTTARAVIVLAKNSKGAWVRDKQAFGTDVLELDRIGETVRPVKLPPGPPLQVRFQLIRHGWGAALDAGMTVFTPKGEVRTEGGPQVFVDGGSVIEGSPHK